LQPQVEAMEHDTLVAMQEPQNKEEETHQEIPPEHIEAAMEVNGMAQCLGVEEKPNETQEPGLGHPVEETIGTMWAWLEWMAGEQPGVVGTSSQQEDRIQIQSSP
jgi:hypothetical protein